jgi:hypothetical protein
VNLQEENLGEYEWTQVDSLSVSETEKFYLQGLIARLRQTSTLLINEATLWARAIYPLLVLAEQNPIQVWAQVPLQAHYAKFELEGIADGVLGRSVFGRLKSPYLVVVETKKGVDSQNPVCQLYAQLLAAAHLNWEQDHRLPQEIFGCYTIADCWTFVKAQVTDIDAETPTLRIEGSREYGEKYEAETIFKILKNIVSKHLQVTA